MEHGNEFQPFTADPVRDDVGRIWYDKLTCPDRPAGPADLRVGLKQSDCFENPSRDYSCVLFRAFFDVLSQLNEVAYRSAGPDDLHLGALLSPGLPQEFNHFDTFSWLTACPDSSSAMPA